MGMSEVIKFPDLSEKLESLLVKAVDEGIKKAEKKVQGRTMNLNGMQVNVDLGTQKVLDNLEKSKKKIEEQKTAIHNTLEDIKKHEYKPSTRGYKLTKDQETHIQQKMNSIVGVSEEVRKNIEDSLKLEAKLINLKDSLLSKINEQKKLSVNGFLNEQEVKDYYGNVVKLQAVMEQLHNLQGSTGTKGHLSNGFNVKTLLKNLKNGDLEKILIKTYENQEKDLQAKINDTYSQAQKNLATNIIKGNPLTAAMDKITAAEKQIKQANENIENETRRLVDELNNIWKDYRALDPDDENFDFAFEDRLKTRMISVITTMQKYEKQSYIDDDIMQEYTDIVAPLYTLNKKTKTTDQTNVYYEISKKIAEEKNKIIENNNEIIKSNNETIASQKEYISSMQWVNDQSVRTAYGDNILNELTSKIQSLQDENEKLKQSFKGEVSTEQFETLKLQLEESQSLITILEEKIESLSIALKKQEELANNLSSAAQASGTAHGNGTGSGEGTETFDSEELNKVNQKIQELESQIVELNKQMASLQSGEEFNKLAEKVQVLETELHNLIELSKNVKPALDLGEGFDTDLFNQKFDSLKELLIQINTMSKEKALSGIVSDQDVSRFVSLSSSISEIASDLSRIDFTKLDTSSLNPENKDIFNAIVNNFKASLKTLVDVINEELEKVKVNPDINEELFIQKINNINAELQKDPIQVSINEIKISATLNRLKANLANIADNSIIENWENNFISAIDKIVSKIDRSFSNLERSSVKNMIQRWQNEQDILNGTRVSYVTKKNKDGNEIIKKGGYGSLERKAFMNTKTGYITSDVYDQANSVSKQISMKLFETATENVNAMLHSHPSGSASFSPQDIKAISGWINKGIVESYVVGAKNIAKINLDGVSSDDIDRIAEAYAIAKENFEKSLDFNNLSLDEKSVKSQELLLDSVNKILKDNSGSLRVQTLNLDDFDSQMKSLENAKNETKQLYDVVLKLDGILNKFNGESFTLGIPEESLNNIFKQFNEVFSNIGSNVNPSTFTENIEAKIKESGKNILVDVAPNVNALDFLASIKSEIDNIATAIEIDVKPSEDSIKSKNNAYERERDIVTSVIDSEISDLSNLDKKLIDITSAVDDKTNAFRQEEQVVSGVVQSEISDLAALSGWVVSLINDIQELIASVSTIPNIELHLDKIDDNEKSKVLEQLAELKTALDGFDYKNLSNLFQGINSLQVQETLPTTIQNLSNAILNLKTNLSDVSSSSFDFLASIKELAKEGDALSNLVKIMSASQNEIKKAQQTAKQQKNEENPQIRKNVDLTYKKGTQEWQDAYDLLNKFGVKLEKIASLSRSIRQDKDGNFLESYKVTYEDGSSRTLGMKNGIVAQRDVIADADKVAKKYSSTLDKLVLAEKKAFEKQDLIAIVDVQDVRKQIDKLEEELKRLRDLGIMSQETFEYLTIQRRNATQDTIDEYKNSVIEQAYKENEAFDKKVQEQAKEQRKQQVKQQIQQMKDNAAAKNHNPKLENYKRYIDARRKEIQERKKLQQEQEKADNKLAEHKKKIQQNRDIESREGIASFKKKDQTELYKSLSTATQEYIYWLKEENKATGSAKENASLLKEESEKLIDSLKADIKSYGLQDLEKELDLNIKILETKRKINYQNASAIEKKQIEDSVKSYDDEISLLKRINDLKIKNISANEDDKAGNIKEIELLEQDLLLLQKERVSKNLVTNEGDNRIKKENLELTKLLSQEQEIYNAKLAKQNELRDQAQKDIIAQNQNATNQRSTISNYFLNEQNSPYGKLIENSVKVENGVAYAEFIKDMGEYAEITKIKITELDKAIEAMNNNTFSSNSPLIKGLGVSTKALKQEKVIPQNILDELTKTDLKWDTAKQTKSSIISSDSELVKAVEKNIEKIKKAFKDGEIDIKEYGNRIEKEIDEFLSIQNIVLNKDNALEKMKDYLPNDAKISEPKYGKDGKSFSLSSTYFDEIKKAYVTVEQAYDDVYKTIKVTESTSEVSFDSIISDFKELEQKISLVQKKSFTSEVSTIELENLNKELEKTITFIEKLHSLDIITDEEYKSFESLKIAYQKDRDTAQTEYNNKIFKNAEKNLEKQNRENIKLLKEYFGISKKTQSSSQLNNITKTLGIGELSSIDVNRNTGVLTFVKYLDDGIEETTVKVKNLQKMLEELGNGTFSTNSTTTVFNTSIKTLYTEDIKNAIQNANNLFNTKKNKLPDGDSFYVNNIKANINKLNQELADGKKTIDEHRKKLQEELVKLNNIWSYADNKDDAIEKMQKNAILWGGNDVKIGISTKGNNDKITVVTAQYKDANNQLKTLIQTFDETQDVIRSTEDTTKASATGIVKFINEMGNKWKEVLKYFLSFGSVYEVWNLLQQGVSVVTELNTALTEMRKVSDESVVSLKRFQSQSFDLATDIGTTAQQIQNSTADFMRIGHNLDVASQLAEHANIYKNVGDMEIDEATEHMISSIQAWKSEFNNEVEASEAIIHRYNEIGMKCAE